MDGDDREVDTMIQHVHTYTQRHIMYHYVVLLEKAFYVAHVKMRGKRIPDWVPPSEAESFKSFQTTYVLNRFWGLRVVMWCLF